MLYFAYGSNLDWERISDRSRAPSAQFVVRATLPHYLLKFTRRSKKQETGTADVVPMPGSLTWGVVFHVDDTDGEKLDLAEGVKVSAYHREQVSVFVENDSSRPLRVWTYVVCQKESKHQQPAQWYLDHIVKGAKRWGLPGDYIARLETIEVEG